MAVSVRRTHAVADCSKSQMTSWKKLFCAPPPSVFLPLKRVHRRSKREKIWVKKTQQHIRASYNHVVEPLSASVRLIVGGNSHDRVRDVAFPFLSPCFLWACQHTALTDRLLSVAASGYLSKLASTGANTALSRNAPSFP